MKGEGQIQRCLTSQLNNNTFGLLIPGDIEDILQCERFKVEPVGNIVVRRYCLGIGIHHDSFVSRLSQRHGGMNATVIKLYTLPDPVGTPSDNHHLFRISAAAFILFIIGGIVVRGVGLEFGGAGIHKFIYRCNALLLPQVSHLRLGHTRNVADLAVGKTELF